ncbi:MAG: hypothetical protein WCC00_05050, partial [Candidatus Aminicenantales bacterium]
EQLPEFLLGRHPSQEVIDAPVDRQTGITIGERARIGGRARAARNKHDKSRCDKKRPSDLKAEHGGILA